MVQVLFLYSNPKAEWPHASITYLGEPGSYGLSDEHWRYIHYANGDEELYHTQKDPYEWVNLAAKSEYADRISRLKALAPTKFAKLIRTSGESLPKLAWHPTTNATPPASQQGGDQLSVVFSNQRKDAVKVFWIDRKGKPKSRGILQSGWSKPLSTRAGAVWLITDSDDKPLCYFVVGKSKANAIIPAE